MTRVRRVERVNKLRRLEGVAIEEGRYRLEKLVALGSAGAVFKARQAGLRRPLAVKVVWTANETARARFLREVGALAAVTHPNLVMLMDHGRLSDHLAYAAMEWVEGQSLSRIMLLDGPMVPRHAVAVVRQVVAALGALHAQGVVHRDVKPANVILGGDGGPDAPVKLVDLDIAHVPDDLKQPGAAPTIPGLVLGTPGFCPPEQLRGEAVDGRADLWAAGNLLRWLVTGEDDGSKDDALPPALLSAVRFATNEDRRHRPPKAATLLQLLDAAAARLDVGLQAVRAPRRPAEPPEPGGVPARAGYRRLERVRTGGTALPFRVFPSDAPDAPDTPTRQP